MLKKKIWANFQRIIELFIQTIVTKLLKIWVLDPGSGKKLFRIPDPGVKKAPDPGSGSAALQIRNPARQMFETRNDLTFPFLSDDVDDPDTDDETWRPQSVWDQKPPPVRRRLTFPGY
jgi:hypothetical protein